MKSQRIVLAVVLVVLVGGAVGFAVADGLRAAASPALSAALAGFALYWLIKHPMPPTRWTRQRVIRMAAVVGPASVAVVAVMIWVIVVNPDWTIRLVAAAAIAVVPVGLLWTVRLARREDRAAKDLAA
ncbi:hypothetical protein [Kribbella catacumbae]|uniref:hypothetical protein n=1 Tax=Kribbella catacumbae TaxID=460086 RepID=UPI00035EEF40|nr:hypothetical protein [Kribbella catacumbae]